jgi:hypothetical protein
VTTEFTNLLDRRDIVASSTEEASLKRSRHMLTASALLVFLAGSTAPFAQEQKIRCEKLPTAVRTAFEKTYPKATINGCATEVEQGKTAYEITSKENRIGRDVLFYDDGTLIVVEETIALGEVPDPVQKAMYSRYSRDQITLAEKVTRDGAVLYEFHVKRKGKLDQVVFDPGGTEVKP